jgi:imidazolonepropionase-like amidohydrolase
VEEFLAVRAAQIFDGERSIGPGMVLCRGQRILDVDTSGAAPPQAATVVDLGSSSCLLPGLIDAHVHLAFDAGPDVVAGLDQKDDDMLLASMHAAASQALRAGVTTVRDLGDRNYLAVVLRDSFTSALLGPEIVASGPPMTTRGGHCHFLGGEVEGGSDLRAAVQERAARGCDVIKVMVSGGHFSPGIQPHESQYQLADLRVVVDEAHRRGLPAAGHVHGVQAVADALEAGFDTLEHVTFFTAEGVIPDAAVMERIVSEGVVVSATVGIVPNRGSVPPALAQRLPAYFDNLRRLHASGARMVPGSDAGLSPVKPHDVLPHSLGALVNEIGMTNGDALRAATSIAARAIGLDGRKGRIMAGADADFVAFRGNPLDDISAVLDVEKVFRAGRQVR